MNKLELKLTNYKKHKNTEIEFETGNLYLVTGENNIGKTSMLTALASALKAKDDTKNPISFGETKGKVECVITNKNGEKTDIIVEYERSKNPRFKILYPDTKVSSKPTDIRNFAQFNEFTVDEFFSWGHTAEGRKKQAEIFLSLIQDKKIVEEIQTKSIEVSPKGELYKKRTRVNSEVDVTNKLVNDNKLTEEEITSLKTLETAKKQLSQIEEEYKEVYDIVKNIRSSEQINNEIQQTDNIINEKTKLIESLKREIQGLEEHNSKLKQEKEQNKDELIEKEKQLASKIEKGKEYIGRISLIKAKEEKYDSLKENLISVSEKAKELNKKIEQYRQDIKNLFNKANYPVSNITIEDNEAYYLDNDNNKIPFVESDLSYSVGGSKVVEILMELNKEMPIIMLGKASEFDSKTKDKFANLAKDKGYIMIADHVVEQQENMEVVVWDLKEDNSSDKTEKTPEEKKEEPKIDNKDLF